MPNSINIKKISSKLALVATSALVTVAMLGSGVLTAHAEEGFIPRADLSAKTQTVINGLHIGQSDGTHRRCYAGA